ncbi:MAG TPA: glycosyltransferase [Planctomycetaceae bacterium]|nr:glycosyltransferase [Planctomycetaceae bacterium]HIQ21377.1 glycosyltransferase [Planctomycetota bacterium]
MKRILHIIPSLDRAGAEKQMSLLVRGLPRDQFDVHVCVLTRAGPLRAELEESAIPVVVIGKRWRVDPQAYWRLRHEIDRRRPDLVQTWIFAANAYGRRAALDCGVKRLVACERCVDPWKGWLELTIDRRLARDTTRIVAVSAGVRDFYVRHGLPAEKFEVIPNGVPPAPPVSTTRQEILAELGLPPESRLVAVVGRLWPQKQIKHAIWAADLLKVIRDDVHLLIIGDGPHHRRLRQFRDQVRIRDKVHFLGHRDDVPRLMPHFDVLWSTSAYEGQSNAIMEAMACGVPVVATDIPGTRDLVIHGQTGFLVPPGVACRRELCGHTNNLLDDRPLARRLGEAARQRMRDHFSVERMVDRYARLYGQLLDA